MRKTAKHVRKQLTARQTERLINQTAKAQLRRSFQMAGLTPDSPPRRAHDRLTRRVLRMVQKPVDKWDIGLLDQLLDAQADMRARLRGLEAFFKMPASRTAS